MINNTDSREEFLNYKTLELPCFQTVICKMKTTYFLEDTTKSVITLTLRPK